MRSKRMPPHNPADAAKFRQVFPAVLLLALGVLINYVDRGNLSIAAPLLLKELHLSASRLGVLFSAFFWTYTFFVFCCGWVVDRYPVNKVMAGGFLIWTIATALTGFANGFIVLLLCRLLLGVGESVAFPASSKILARNVPASYLGLANGCITWGLKIGPAVGSLGAGLLMAKYGWRPVFIWIGLGSLLWIPLWWKVMPRPEPEAHTDAGRSETVADIFAEGSFWGASAGHFCGNYILYFLVTWLPLYLVRDRHLSMQSMSKTAALYYVVESSFALLTGFFTDFMIRRGHSQTLVRKGAMVLGHLTSATGLVLCVFAGPRTYLAALFVIGVGCGLAGSGIFTFAQILAGRRVVGRWVGLQNGFGNFAGIIGPALTGVAVDWTGSFAAAIFITAGVSICGALAWSLLIGPVEEIPWRRRTTVLLSANVLQEHGRVVLPPPPPSGTVS